MTDAVTLHYVPGPDGEPIAEPDQQAWWGWYEANSALREDGTRGKQVGCTTIGAVEVSTVFTGWNLAPWCDAVICYESLVFGPHDFPLTDECDRYATRAEALAGHAALVARVEAALAGEG